jgi:hypothetical protein
MLRAGPEGSIISFHSGIGSINSELRIRFRSDPYPYQGIYQRFENFY